MAKKITRTVITHFVTFGKIEGTTITEIHSEERPAMPESKELAEMSKEHGAQVVVMMSTPMEHKYSMDLEKFMNLADEETEE